MIAYFLMATESFCYEATKHCLDILDKSFCTRFGDIGSKHEMTNFVNYGNANIYEYINRAHRLHILYYWSSKT